MRNVVKKTAKKDLKKLPTAAKTTQKIKGFFWTIFYIFLKTLVINFFLNKFFTNTLKNLLTRA